MQCRWSFIIKNLERDRMLPIEQCISLLMPGVVVLSWYPPGVADEHGKPTEDLVPAVMDAAHRHSIKVTGERSIKPVCLHKHFVFKVLF